VPIKVKRRLQLAALALPQQWRPLFSIVGGTGHSPVWPLTSHISQTTQACSRSIMSSVECGRLADWSQFESANAGGDLLL
jgi:hypothetical protein